MSSPLFDSPKSFRLRQLADTAFATLHQRRDLHPASQPQISFVLDTAAAAANATMPMLQLAGSGGKADIGHLAGLVSEAVLEVVFVALPGFLVAVTGMFDANSQRFVAQLNTMVFTPCLVFMKLASQLTADKLADLLVIPFIFVAQTLVSYMCAQLMAWAFGFQRKDKTMQKNFILAMGVFGNSNSLPISLVLSLSSTIKGLHWDQIPGDNDDEVAARGILYLLIFQQLGQLLRWTWGYNVLLKPKSAYEEEEIGEIVPDRAIEEGSYRDDPDEEVEHRTHAKPSRDSAIDSDPRVPGGVEVVPATPANGNVVSQEPNNLSARSDETLRPRSESPSGDLVIPKSFDDPPSQPHIHDVSSLIARVRSWLLLRYRRWTSATVTFSNNLFRRFPRTVQKALSVANSYNKRFWVAVWNLMNPPLWAMLVAIVVASIPRLQHLFFDRGTFVNNSITHAIQSSGNVAVPLILVVLGANLARSTLPQDQIAATPGEKREERKLLFASILSRMVLPTVIMAPLLAIVAKWAPVSIMDDPIFIVVCFLLTGAPSALQLSQICQINNVFMGVMSSLLVASYVVAIFPSTLILVLMALEVVQWAVI